MTTLAPIQPITFGPTWQRGEDGKFVLPELTLGWQVIDWCEQYLLQPDGPDAGEPWRFTKEQSRFVLWWYAIDPRGRFLKRSGMLRRMKGWGKDPLVAALCCVEFVGPCRFGGMKRNSDPIAVAHSAAWVQVAAVSKDQTRNTMTLFPGMLSRKAIEEFSIDMGKEIMYAHRGAARIEAVTSSPRALEGGRATFTVKNESHHWIRSNEGTEMSAVIARNAAKSRDGSSRVLAISNAHAPGEGSDAEHDYEAAMVIARDGKANPSDFLYDSIEAQPFPSEDWPPAVEEIVPRLESCRGDSEWLDVTRLTAEIRDPRTTKSQSCRFYFNQLHAGEDKAFDQVQWESLKREGYTVPDGALIGIGFDGSRNRDWTALIATEIGTGYQWVLGIWEPKLHDDGVIEIQETEVDAAVTAAFERWNVWRMNGDPFWWKEWMAKWAGKYNKPGEEVVVSWNTTLYKKMAYALLEYRNAMQDGVLSHSGDKRFASAIGNAHKNIQAFVDDNGDPMWTIEKERPDSPLKIDAAIAGCLSWEARRAAIEAGVLEGNRPSVYEERGFLTL